MTSNSRLNEAREEYMKRLRAQKYANIMLDWTFKKVFGQEQNKNVLISLLNSILPELRIADLEYRTTDFLSKVADNRNFILDLHEAKYDDKVVYNYIFKEKDTNEVANPTIMVTFVELNKFTKAENECKTELEQWFYVLKNSERIRKLTPAFRNEVFKQVFKELDVATFTREERMRHFRENLAKYDAYMQEAFYREKGLSEGRTEGLEQGKLEIAGKMKVKGLDYGTIAECTGLSLEQIESL